MNQARKNQINFLFIGSAIFFKSKVTWQKSELLHEKKCLTCNVNRKKAMVDLLLIFKLRICQT